MHEEMKRELPGKINGNQKEFDPWRKVFNGVRPHEALGMKTPVEVYKSPPGRGTGKRWSRNTRGN
ncbi:MAG: hypothetical protein LBQ30_00835 [Treponema sp.]|jgi:hypothetical protein|nr:hypothetical protein [Treponema sp.]